MTTDLSALIRDIPDFPQSGILFRDITTLLKDSHGFRETIDRFVQRFRPLEPDVVVGMESRGFIFGAPIAYALNAGFVPVRKLGRLPHDTISVQYSLEYGQNTLEMHRDAIEPGQRVLVIDDLLATGGTVNATIELIEKLGGVVIGVGFVIELRFLNGRKHLDRYLVETLISY